LVFPDASKVIERLCTSKLAIIEFGWYYDRTIHFKLDLMGAADIIKIQDATEDNVTMQVVILYNLLTKEAWEV